MVPTASDMAPILSLLLLPSWRLRRGRVDGDELVFVALRVFRFTKTIVCVVETKESAKSLSS
jgi:hypothetical protein